MKSNKGFTLVELLAVIAILAILVLIALPNTMEMFKEAKKNSFLTECKQIYKTAQNQWMSDSMFDTNEQIYSRCDSCSGKSLKLSGRDQIDYYVRVNKAGKIMEFYVTDGTYQFEHDENELLITDITDAESIAGMDDSLVLSIANDEVFNGSTSSCKYKLVTTLGSFSPYEDVKEICLKTTKDNYTFSYSHAPLSWGARESDSDILILGVNTYRFTPNTFVRVYRDSTKRELLAEINYNNRPDLSRINLNNYYVYTDALEYDVEVNATSPDDLYMEKSDDLCYENCLETDNFVSFMYTSTVNKITFTKPWVNDSDTLSSIENLKNSLDDPHYEFGGFKLCTSSECEPNTYEAIIKDSTIK